MLTQLRIVLIHTTHPGNIGSAARAMKTMGLESLYLVAPELYPHAQATSQASGADDLLANATVVPTLEQAIADCHLIIGTSARERTLAWMTATPRQGATQVKAAASKGQKIAILFGQERIGLTNEQLAVCHQQIVIPTSALYSSLNLAQAVQIIAYELHLASREEAPVIQTDAEPAASGNDMALFYQHFTEVLGAVDFIKATSSSQKLLLRIHRLFGRACPSQRELNILRGFLTAVQQKLKLLE